MKKILSIALALALVLSVMSVSVLAADKTYDGSGNAGQYWLVGTQNPAEPDKLDNGVATFVPGDVSANVKINFNNTSTNNPGIPGGGGTGVGDGDAIEDRYAIDIEYKNLVIDLTDIPNQYIAPDADPSDDKQEIVTITYIWNVNTHQYDKKETSRTVTNAEATAAQLPGSDPSTSAIVIDAFQVINHSSLSIWYNAALATESNADAVMDLELTGVSATNLEVKRATTGQETKGDLHTIKATPATNWQTTINALSDANYVSGSVVASLTVTFAMSDGAVTTATPTAPSAPTVIVPDPANP